MNVAGKNLALARGFTLAEVIAVVVISALVLVAMITIHSHAQASVATVERHLGTGRLAREVLQLIAEDLDRMTTGAGSDTKIYVKNKPAGGYQAAQLRIVKTIDTTKPDQEFETVVWQTSPDYESDANGLVLYRKHSGLVSEDKLLDEQRADWERAYPFVAVCSGVTYFSVKVPGPDNTFFDTWPGKTLPRGLVVEISFAEPYETEQGTFEIPPEQLYTRNIAINRTRNIKFVFFPEEYKYNPSEPNDLDELAEPNLPESELGKGLLDEQPAAAGSRSPASGGRRSGATGESQLRPGVGPGRRRALPDFRKPPR